MKRIVYLCIILILSVATMFANIPTPLVYASNSVDNLNTSYQQKAYVLMDYNTDTILGGANYDEKYQVASIVKLMTILLTLEALEDGKINLDDMVTASEHSSSMGGSQAFLDANQQYMLSDLLKSVIVSSANDSSVLLGEVLAGSENGFVEQMNKRAKELGLNNTLYSNATGLPDANQYSSALDSARLLKEVMKHKTYFNYSTIWLDGLTHPLDKRTTELANTNRLVRYYNGCDAGKTGYTDEAGYCLVASAKKNGMRLMGVTLGATKSKDRFESVTELLNLGFASYKNEHIAVKDAELNETIKVKGAKNSVGKLTFDNDFYYITKKSDKNGFEIKFELPKTVKAPLEKGQYIGKAYIIKDGSVIGEVDVVSYEQMLKQTYREIVKKIFKGFGI
ncbi:MAG: D-alanyl-D-alanine carboxypeptidase [Tenericutes bacterium HGW-Tenericutes-4]|jgi:D-alanyl-D-alanine carboxypeptidase (penicillin-binding protein 5/6)|nr:MAG: D-alanyl-D-alanine carboxypeptidase [Tenericutes bacterium HGW-Tenericutes-4]